jgi:hypothetical protein
MNDLTQWLHSSVEKAKYFLTDLTRKPMPDLVAILEEDAQFVKGVIIESMRPGDIGALWWTIRDDVQIGLEMNYFDVSTVKPIIRALVPVPEKRRARSISRSRDRAHGRSR